MTDRAAYMREYRAGRDNSQDQRQKRARSRALCKLKQMHRQDYERLYQKELAREVDASG